MKFNFSLKFIILGLMGILFFTACTDDTPDEDTLATLTFEPGTGYVTGDSDISIGSSFTVRLKATKGTNDMKVLRIKEGDSNVSLDRLTIDGNAANANPLLLFGSDKSSLDYVITVDVHNSLESKTYNFEIEDEKGNTSVRSLTINVNGTPVTTLTGVLLNQGGPINTGGLNLLTGASVGSLDASAHIKDEGIDLGLPVSSNWKQQISGANGSELKYLVKGQNGIPENFALSGITLKEQISSLWSAGTSFDVSNKINVGDFIMVLNGTNYFLLEVKDVNLTTDDNSDNYVFDIKY